MRPARIRHSRLLAKLMLAVALATPVALAGCDLPDVISFPQQSRGNRVEAERLAQMVPGTSTRADAIALIGSPTAKAAFDDNTWIYIGELTKPMIGATNVVRDQSVVVLGFDQQGVLRRIETKAATDGYDIAVVTDATPAPGSDATFLQQLLGNIGRFNPGGSGSGPSASGSNRSSGGNY